MKKSEYKSPEQYEKQLEWSKAYRAKNHFVNVSFSESEFRDFKRKYNKAKKDNPKLSMAKFLKTLALKHD